MAPDSPAMRTRSRARLALNPVPPEDDDVEDSPSPSPSPSPSAADEPAKVKYATSIDFEFLPDPARERIYQIIESWSSSPGRLSPVIQQLATMSVSLRADLKPRLWGVVEYYPPATNDPSASSRKRDLRKLDQLNKGSTLPVEQLHVHGLSTASVQQLTERTATAITFEESKALASLVGSLGLKSLRELALTNMVLKCEVVDLLIGKLTLSAIEHLSVREITIDCSDDEPATHRVRLHAALPHLEHLELVNTGASFYNIIPQTSSLDVLIIVDTEYPISIKHADYVVQATQTIRKLSITTAGVGPGCCKLLQGISNGGKILLQELLLRSAMTSEDLGCLPAALRQAPHLVRLVLHHAGPYSAAFVGNVVDSAPGLAALSLIVGVGSGETMWKDEFGLYLAQISRLHNLRFLALDVKPPAPTGRRSPRRPQDRERDLLREVAGACEALSECFLVTGWKSDGLTGQAARFEEDEDGDLTMKLCGFKLDEFTLAHAEWLGRL